MNRKKELPPTRECAGSLLAIKDTMELLAGKWKIQIIGSLMMNGKLRFMDLLREVNGISAKMLSKELQELEMNELLTRSIMNTKPITVEYELTDHGKTLQKVIQEIAVWGNMHRNKIINR